jgi:hypothetical protein
VKESLAFVFFKDGIREIRFFKGILGEELHDKIINDKKNLSPEELYKAYETKTGKQVERNSNDDAPFTALASKW